MSAGISRRLDDSLCEAVTRRLASIEIGQSIFAEADHKFVVEAIIATSVASSTRAVELNRRLGDGLFSANIPAILACNPRRVTLYALPLAFLYRPPAAQPLVISLFRRLHEANATKALSYPTYRNYEIDYVYQRITGRSFFLDPFENLGQSFPWLSRDIIYGLTHIHFYNTDFFRGKVRYAPLAPAIIDALIAKANAEGDHDVLLELMLCQISAAGTDSGQRYYFDHLVLGILGSLMDLETGVLSDRPFEETYHVLFLAWMYIALRGDAFEARCPESEAGRLAVLGRTMIAMRSGGFMDFFADYADYLDGFGPNAAVETVLPLYGDLIEGAVARAATTPPLALANCAD